MTNIEALLTNRWILKRNNRELYYAIKDDAKNLRKYFLDAFGYSLIVHSEYIRLDKIPGKAEPWMGITDFKTKEEYQIFCIILMFLEEKDNEEQFILSNLCEYIQLQLSETEEYWNSFTNRKKLVNVIKFCLKEQLFLQDDGETSDFAQNESSEVLFESTGLSRYFMRNFTYNIFEKTQYEDFLEDEWERQEDRGNARKHRIYRRLLLSIGIYEEDKNLDDFDYIRRFRKSIQKDFQTIAPYDLQVQKNSAYVVLNEEEKFGNVFPKNNALDESLILVFSELRNRVKHKTIELEENEGIRLEISYVKNLILKVLKKEWEYFPVTYRKKKEEVFVEEVLDQMELLGFAWKEENLMVFAPSIGKWNGYYKE